MLSSIQYLAARIAAWFRLRHLDRDFDLELESHLALLAEEHVRRGMTAEQARRAALVQLGGVAQLREAHRETRGLPRFDALLRDLHYGLRALRRNPGLNAVAVLTLAIAIGVNVAVFTVYNAVVLRPVDAADPGRLMQITRNTRDPMFSYSDYAYYRDRGRAFSGLAAMTHRVLSLSGVASRASSESGGLLSAAGIRFPRVLAGGSESVTATLVSGNYFQLLGVNAAMGRVFVQQEDAPGADAVALVSENFWERRFARDPALLGRSLTLNGVGVAIIGITASDFRGTSAEVPDVWIPLSVQSRLSPREEPLVTSPSGCCRVYGRLAAGAVRGQAEAEMNALAAGLPRSPPEDGPGHQRIRFVVGQAVAGGQPGNQNVAGPIFLLGAVGLILLIACANVASLLLARSAARHREISIRLAIGASRGRLIRQLLTENSVIGLLAGVAGVLLSWWSLRFLMATIGAQLGWHVAPDLRVFGYLLFLTMAATMGFGLAPALEASRANLSFGLKDEGALGGRLRRSHLRDLMIGVQVAVCLVLLVAAGLMARASQRALAIDLGFDYHNVLSLEVVFPAAVSPVRIAAARAQLAEELEALPEIQSVAVSSHMPLSHGNLRETVISPSGGGGSAGPRLTTYTLVSPGYFETMRIPIVRGRNFTARESRDHSDFEGSQVIVSETTARHAWPGEDPIGKVIAFGPRPGWRRLSGGDDDSHAHSVSSSVIGVARDVRSVNLDSVDDTCLYLPVTRGFGGTASGGNGRPNGVIMMRARGDERRAVTAVMRLLQSAHGDLQSTVGDSRTAFTDQPTFTISRAGAIGAAIIGILGMLMAAVGIHGSIGFAVAQRTQEIGIRMALGAQRGHVLSLILLQTMRPVAVGLAVGVALAALAARLMGALLAGFSAHGASIGSSFLSSDAVAYLGASCLLGAAALLAGYAPARRAARVDPIIALRCD